MKMLNLLSMEDVINLSTWMRQLSPLSWCFCVIKHCHTEGGHWLARCSTKYDNYRNYSNKANVSYVKKSSCKRFICLNFWDEAWSFLSFRLFGLLSLLLYSQQFGWYVLWPSSGVSCWTREPTQNLKLH